MDPNSTARADRATLRSPVRLSSGAVRYEAVATSAGAKLQYSWGVEVVHEDALTDPAYLDALRGAQVIMDPALHWSGIDVNEHGEAIMGVVTLADFRDGQQVVELTLNRADAIEWVERNMRNPPERQPGVSVRYDVVRMDNGFQMQRTLPDHVQLTLNPRDTTARIRADEVPIMTEAELKAALAEALAPFRGTLSELTGRADAQAAKLNEIQAAMPKARADQADPPNGRRRAAAVERVAASYGIDLPEADDIAECEAKVFGALAAKGGFRADGLDAATYIVALDRGLGKTATTKRADGLTGQRRPETNAPTHTTTEAAVRAAFNQE